MCCIEACSIEWNGVSTERSACKAGVNSHRSFDARLRDANRSLASPAVDTIGVLIFQSAKYRPNVVCSVDSNV